LIAAYGEDPGGLKHSFMKYCLITLLLSLFLEESIFSQGQEVGLMNTITFKFEKGDSTKKFSHKGKENISTIYIKQEKTFEYFYSSTGLLQKYSIGRVYQLGHDTLMFVSDTSMFGANASDLIKKNKHLNQYFFQEFDRVKFFCSSKELLLLTPVPDLNSRRSVIKVIDLKQN